MTNGLGVRRVESVSFRVLSTVKPVAEKVARFCQRGWQTLFRSGVTRGADGPQATLFSSLTVEDRIPADHPLRMILAPVNPILTARSPRFETLYGASVAAVAMLETLPPRQRCRTMGADKGYERAPPGSRRMSRRKSTPGKPRVRLAGGRRGMRRARSVS